jgi:hypothetical protein
MRLSSVWVVSLLTIVLSSQAGALKIPPDPPGPTGVSQILTHKKDCQMGHKCHRSVCNCCCKQQLHHDLHMLDGLCRFLLALTL